MRLIRLFAALVPLALAGCISYASAPPAKTTVTVPPGSTVTCANGTQPPC